MGRPFALPRRPDPPIARTPFLKKSVRSPNSLSSAERSQRSDGETRRGQVPNILYSTKVAATGGRNGSIRSDDGLLDLRLALPRSLGGKGDATNPEQLFAGGYAACFENALLRVSREARHHFADDDVEVVSGNPSGE